MNLGEMEVLQKFNEKYTKVVVFRVLRRTVVCD